MQRFKNILVLYDRKIGDEAALDRAAALARTNNARLTVVEAIEKLPRNGLTILGNKAAQDADLQRRFLEERQAHLERLVTSIRRNGVTVNTMVLRGRTFIEVIRLVLRQRYDIVVMTADSWRGLRQITFGSTSMHLMRKCPSPVWVMKPKSRPQFHRIIAAVDPSVTDEVPDALNVQLIQLASSLAVKENCHLDIVHAWDFPSSDLDTSRSEISEDILTKLVEKNEAVHQASMNRILEKIDLEGVDFNVRFLQGEPEQVIPQFAHDNQADLIVMGSASRVGIAGMFIGPVAEDVLRQVDCSVLTIKPNGFVSPVLLHD